MRKKRFRQIGCAALAFLMLLLCGCGLAGQNKQSRALVQAEMDELLVQFMTCVENNDLQGACALAYGPEQMPQYFPSIVKYWPARHDDPYEASGLEFDNARPDTDVMAVYLVRSGGEDFQVTMIYRRDDAGEGLVSLNAARIREMLESGRIPQALGQPIAEKSIGQWCFIGFWILMCLLCLLAIVDLIRTRPKLYPLWCLLCLVFVGVCVYSSIGGVSFVLRFGFLNASKWTRYPCGVDSYQVCLPIGAIVYWCRRLPGILLQRRQRRSGGDTSSGRRRHSAHAHRKGSSSSRRSD